MYFKKSIVIFSLLTTGCTSLPTAPVKLDPLYGLIDSKLVVDSPEKTIPITKRSQICMLISPNTERYLKYNEEDTKAQRDWNPVLRKDLKDKIEANGDPTFLANSIVSILKRYFSEVTLVDDFNKIKDRGCAYSVVMDISLIKTSWTVSKATTDIEAIFFDKALRRVSSAKGHGEFVSPRDGSPEAYQANSLAQKAAVLDFEHAIDNFMSSAKK